MTEAYIYDAVRTPRGKGRKDGSLHEVSAARLSAVALNALKERNGLEGHAVEDVIWGNVTQVAEQGACLARTAVLASDLDESIPGLSINRFCASGLEAVNVAANQVRGGAGNGYIAGGVECMSRVPMGSDGGAIAVDHAIPADNSCQQHFRHGLDNARATNSGDPGLVDNLVKSRFVGPQLAADYPEAWLKGQRIDAYTLDSPRRGTLT